MITLTIFNLLLVVGLIEAVNYLYGAHLQISQAMSSNEIRAQYISQNLDEAISSMNLLLDSVTTDSDFQQLLSTPVQTTDEENELNSQLEKMLVYKTVLSSDKFEYLFLYDTNKIRVKLNFNSSRNIDSLDEGHYKFDKSRYDMLGGTTWRKYQGIIYIDRAIRQRDTLKTLGYITLSVNYNYLKERIFSEPNSYIYVFNENNDLIVQNDNDGKLNASSVLPLVKNPPSKPNVVDVQPIGKMLLTTYKSDFGNWRVVSLVPITEIAKDGNLFGVIVILIGIIGICIGFVMTWVISSRITYPLQNLKHVMSQVEQDNFQIRASIQRQDEFGSLSQSFNHMMDKIDYLISEVYQKELAQKEAEYKALKAQINPHFLYNTLEIVRWLASFGDTEKIEMVIVSLAKLLKASITSTSRELNSVKEETDYINAYIAIQKMRFQDRIEVSIYLEETIMDCFLPKLILQPIIENAFVHGFQNKIGVGHLMIKGKWCSEGVVFQVIDDGTGIGYMNGSELIERDPSLTGGNKGTGNGIFNVHKRIRLLYGEPYGLNIQSVPEIGTVVEILLPRISEKEVYNEHSINVTVS